MSFIRYVMSFLGKTKKVSVVDSAMEGEAVMEETDGGGGECGS